jgi:Pectinacetylesterase
MARITSYILQILFVALTVVLFLFHYDALNYSQFIPIQDTRNCSRFDGQLYKIYSDTAKCMDGSPPAYFLRHSLHDEASSMRGGRDSTNTSASHKWHIHFEGGGWCYDLATCAERSKYRLGSSKSYPQCNGGEFKDYLSHKAEENPLMHGWNHVLVKYCDSASYAGDSVQVHEVLIATSSRVLTALLVIHCITLVGANSLFPWSL